ncbi:MAG: alpha/beta hydrolase [Myxococcales bacterium]|nr:alpha/beta hydrolase [Myxococcales bacterium]
MNTGRVDIAQFESVCLQGNPLGDPSFRRFPVYLPPGYSEGTARFPVIYHLPAFAGTALQAENSKAWEERLSDRLDRLIGSGQCPPVIVVTPDCFTRRGGSQYLNSSAVGNYETYLIDEVIPFVDQNYRTLARPEARGVMGRSSGGFGALYHTMKHPEVFGALASHAGDAGFELCYAPDFPGCVTTLEGVDPDDYLEDFLGRHKKPGHMFHTINVLGMSACYSPNPNSPYGYDLPFDPYDGTTREAVWKRWLAHDPVRLVDDPACIDALRNASLVFVDAGTKDNFNLHLGARRLVKKMREAGIDVVHEEYPDDHFGLVYRYDRSIPLLATALWGDQIP